MSVDRLPFIALHDQTRGPAGTSYDVDWYETTPPPEEAGTTQIFVELSFVLEMRDQGIAPEYWGKAAPKPVHRHTGSPCHTCIPEAELPVIVSAGEHLRGGV